MHTRELMARDWPARVIPEPHVLVVDDEVDVQATVKQALEREGFTVTVAPSGEEAILAVEHARFDVIILDKELPDIAGLDLTFFFRHRSPGVPIVLTTRYNGPLAVAAARHRGASRCLTKPVPIAQLADLLRRLIRRGQTVVAGDLSETVGVSASPMPGPVWAVVLARRDAGAGARTGPIRLREVMDSVGAQVPPERTVVVTTRRLASELRAAFPATSAPRLLVLPRDAGTAAEVLLAAHWIHRQDPRATVAVLSGDGTRAGRWLGARGLVERLINAAEFVDRHPPWIVLLGAVAPSRNWRGGWIRPAEVLTWTRCGPVWRVQRIAGGPPPATARSAHVGFANTGVFVGKAAGLVEACRVFLPRLHQRLVRAVPFVGTAAEALAMRRSWAGAPRPDLGQALLEPCTPTLAVVRADATDDEGRRLA